MAKSNTAKASQGASRTSRNGRRQAAAPRWIRSYCRANRALDASLRLIESTQRTVNRSERCAHRRPVQTSLTLNRVAGQLVAATSRLVLAVRDIAACNENLILERNHETAVLGPNFLVDALQRWAEITGQLQATADGVFSLHEDILRGLVSGELVPERPAERRRRIILAPRPHAIRDFLRSRRQPRVVDRIAVILRRRRRTPRPASIRVPRRNLLGRAPPLFL
jgi:hypothetical protein